jgi:hypothetical protein
MIGQSEILEKTSGSEVSGLVTRGVLFSEEREPANDATKAASRMWMM